MKTQLRKVRRYLSLLEEHRWTDVTPVREIGILPTDYKTSNDLPSPDLFTPYEIGTVWGAGYDTHAWFRFTLPPVGKDTFLHVNTEHTGWDANNPQFLVYLNGRIVQGLDTNHLEVMLEAGKPTDVYLYGYVGNDHKTARLYADTRRLSLDVDGLYYDLLFPFEALSFLDPEGQEYADTLYHLHRAVSLLSLYEVGSEEFYDSVRAARAYMKRDFYEGYCGDTRATTVCIGHTHIDCAWKWTLRQTREKVQRSFSTVLELMRRYPEYKFMSSQALLYKNLKEEAPELYAEVKERIREGRWECEGAMWVEADCNLSSGESLVRQVLYGKRFFLDEFGVESRVLWLPDVFGYSAALPQILKKSGVDWFVTSKISWNDTNRMPVDTFRWRGIDGTEINSYFLTAQDDKGGASDRYTTYVAHTRAQMISGAVKRYAQKQLNNESLLTFGFGDGGGGPTAHHLEEARRGAYGVPGVPRVKIDFAGEFLSRLEKKIEGNPLLPVWQGELYLEFHRGTYTTMSRNKRYNRKCEFLYQNAELCAAIAGALCAHPYPAERLHHGWEIILTNQFHDIIPGSSIKPVYDQSDVDYAEATAIGEEALRAAQDAVASRISRDEGYVVFNPNAHGGSLPVRVNGVTAYADGISPKGYTAVRDFTADNHVRIEGQTVETDLYRVTFDEAYQITSIYDKRERREVLRAGAIGNELRLYADYPDDYDAWEWQAYSREEYKPLSALASHEIVSDGIRRGIRLVRPYASSTVTQTIWFYDSEERIDFETVADWHERHVMLKAAFPVEINAASATYDVQFGTVERPTHENTSWDAARFEVCAHKFADLSDGSYGVAILNDCKYGHDIHNGVIQLSLLRSPTDPNPEADQGEIPFTYALCPHVGTLGESRVRTDAYTLNNPLTALPATGDKTTLPTSFSALCSDRENVVCETLKPAEDGRGTVARIFEYANRRALTHFTTDLPVSRAYLCDMLEREICEIPFANGSFDYTLGGFEIVTLKLI